MVISGLIDSNQHTKKSVDQKHQQKSIYAISIVHSTTHNLTLHGMARYPTSMKSEHLDVTCTPSPPLLKS